MKSMAMSRVMSVDVVARDVSTAWWCSADVAALVSAFVDWSPECSLGFAIRSDFVFLLQRIISRLQLDGSELEVHASSIQRALEAAAQRGCQAVIKWLVMEHPALVGRARLMDKAAASGQLELLCWLYGKHKSGHQELAPCTVEAMDGAAANGFLGVVQWLHKQHQRCTTRAMDEAAAGGFVAVVRWLHTNRVEGCTANAMDAAARNGHLQIVEFLHTNRQEGGFPRAIVGAAERGHAHIVRFLWENRLEQREQADTAMTYAAWRGHAPIVRFLLEQRVAAVEALILPSETDVNFVNARSQPTAISQSR